MLRMAFVTTEDRVDRLEAQFGQFLTEIAVLIRKADEREKAAEERMTRFENEMRDFKNEMGEFKDEMRASKRAMDKQWGDLANKLGTIIEDILAPNLKRLAIEHFGFPHLEDFGIRRLRRQSGRLMEFDTVVVGPAAVILGEAKSSPSLDHAEAFAAKVKVFFDYFPEHHGRRLIAVLGSWAIPQPVVERLTTLGIYAMAMGEDTMELVNAAELEPGKPGGPPASP
jgi:hypothetical protein